MGLKIHAERVTAENAGVLVRLCPFGALEYENGALIVNGGCKSCKLCVQKGPAGVVTWEEGEKRAGIDKSAWRGVAVFAEQRGGALHPVTMELLGKAKELAGKVGHPVYAVLIGSGAHACARELLHYGADRVYHYDDPAFLRFRISPYAEAFHDFILQARPSSILVGATNLGRSLAPRVAARCNTGLTADCTALEVKGNTDLVQIRPAFGGNIMAQIVTPAARPQFCTVRYKVFSAAPRSESASGEIIAMPVSDKMRQSRTEVLSVEEKPKEVDISEADVIVACGRGVKSEAEMARARELALLLQAQLACTRPMVEAGHMNPKRQIGLSGRTVKPKLIITLGISGAVQFAAGMKGADLIVAVNSDPKAPIFDVAHIGIVGDLGEITEKLIERIRGGEHGV